MKYRSGGSTPPKPTAAERAADAKFRKSVKDLKPTPEQAAAIGRANRSSGYAKGGKVKKMAMGGIPAGASTKAPLGGTALTAPTATPTQSQSGNSGVVVGRTAPSFGGGPTATPTQSQSASMAANMARQTPPATGNRTNMGAAARNARMGPVVERAKGGAVKMSKGGKAKAKSFAATKFGKALVKKSADTKGRAMPKFAKGGSIDGCAVRGKTKARRVTMKKGGSC